MGRKPAAITGGKPRKAAAEEPRSTTRNSLVRQAILDRAVDLFHERGFAETSLQTIAESLELTRGAIYYYYKNKDDILRQLVEDVTLPSTELPEMRPEEVTWSVALHRLVRERVHWVIDRRKYFRLLTEVERFLPADLAKQHLEARRRLIHLFEQFIDRGIVAGEFNSTQSTVASFALIGMVSWIAWWFGDSKRLSAIDVSEGMAALAVRMLAKGDSNALLTDSVGDLMQRLRADIDLLDHRLQS